jgi:hypothetical protein
VLTSLTTDTDFSRTQPPLLLALLASANSFLTRQLREFVRVEDGLNCFCPKIIKVCSRPIIAYIEREVELTFVPPQLTTIKMNPTGSQINEPDDAKKESQPANDNTPRPISVWTAPREDSVHYNSFLHFQSEPEHTEMDLQSANGNAPRPIPVVELSTPGEDAIHDQDFLQSQFEQEHMEMDSQFLAMDAPRFIPLINVSPSTTCCAMISTTSTRFGLWKMNPWRTSFITPKTMTRPCHETSALPWSSLLIRITSHTGLKSAL